MLKSSDSLELRHSPVKLREKGRVQTTVNLSLGVRGSQKRKQTTLSALSELLSIALDSGY